MTDTILTQALADAMARTAEDAAIAAAKLVGRGDEKAADQAAVDAMRTALNGVEMKGRVVIGEGERDEAPMLYIGEEVGLGRGPEIDIALDPLEGTTLTAKAMANALAVLAVAPKGTLLFSPDVYMDKLAIGPGYPNGIVDLDKSPSENAKALADAKGVPLEQITACVLDRPRHKEIITDLRNAGVRVHLISDGDVAGVINTTEPHTGIDFYVGQGGAPEGVLAAAALKCVGGQMQARLHFRNDEERQRAYRVGIEDLNRKYDLNDLASSETIFCAAGVTKGELVGGVRVENGYVHTETLVMTSWDGVVRIIKSRRPLL